MIMLQSGVDAFVELATKLGTTVANNAGSSILAAGQGTSLISYSKNVQVEPLVVVDSAISYSDMLPDVMQSLLNQFAGYYLQSAALLLNVNKLEAISDLERLNPNRQVSKDVLFSGLNSVSRATFSAEALVESTSTSGSTTVGKDTLGNLREMSDLAFGKLINIEVSRKTGTVTRDSSKEAKNSIASTTDNEQTYSVPIRVRLLPAACPTADVVDMLSSGLQNVTLDELWHGWRSGALSFIKDVVLCKDFLDARRSTLMKENDGLYKAIVNRQKKGFLASLLTGKPTINNCSNIAVLSSSTAEQIESILGGKLSSPATRAKVFGKTSLMMMAIIDQEWNKVTFYYHSIDESVTLSPRDIKASNKGSGPDIAEILAAYQLGKAPNL